MNAKKAKALRKLLRNMVNQQPENLPEHQFIEVRNTHKEVYVTKDVTDSSEGSVEKVRIFDGQKRNSPQSQRAVYLHLKKEMVKVK